MDGQKYLQTYKMININININIGLFIV